MFPPFCHEQINHSHRAQRGAKPQFYSQAWPEAIMAATHEHRRQGQCAEISENRRENNGPWRFAAVFECFSARKKRRNPALRRGKELYAGSGENSPFVQGIRLGELAAPINSGRDHIPQRHESDCRRDFQKHDPAQGVDQARPQVRCELAWAEPCQRHDHCNIPRHCSARARPLRNRTRSRRSAAARRSSPEHFAIHTLPPIMAVIGYTLQPMKPIRPRAIRASRK